MDQGDGGPGRRALLAGAAGLLLPAAAPAGPVLTARRGQTSLVVPMARPVAWRLSATARPARLILELPNLPWRGPDRLPGAGLVAEARREGSGASQSLVLLLAGPVAAPQVRVAGGRLTILLGPGSAAGFARLADGKPLAIAALAQRGPLPLVVLDPGHGGRDPGTIGGHGTHEKRITLAAALELKRQLEAAGRCRVALTRSRDVFIPLGDRVEFARRRQAALFLSMHADSAPGARGASVYTLSETASDGLAAGLAQRENQADRAGGLRLPSVPPEVQRILLSLIRQETRSGSERMARLVVGALEGEVPLLPNTHRRAGFVVLKAPDVPAALVEMGFLSNPQDEAALNRAAHRARVAASLAEAVHGFLGAGQGRAVVAATG
ncbi:N-acetylmuramoyl-L-alanine amidase [Belnapia sp. T6]|uniref:N-acetylmuramoyl-L-alanine amidase n=1 Tax=Belnapia mucosa TaxID=2804532 RepID=A0ABS1V7F6_9PROT|nr:N-acetylmuramoyl-L-alanine amidase [Belnapia mucosa]MBL6457101.1 N-acetylmuramoyl-L-alanine amidase [Belnapia mucosa]